MNLTFVACFLLACSSELRLVSGLFQNTPNLKTDTDEEVLRKWTSMDRKLKETVGSISKWLIPNVVRFATQLDLSLECNTALLKVILGTRDLKTFALQMLDSSGKFGGGQLTGTLSSFGDYDSCVDIQVPSNGLAFKGQYCMVDFRPSIPAKPKIVYAKATMPVFENLTGTSEIIAHATKLVWGLYTTGYRMGLCVPSVCSVDDIEQLTEKLAELIEFNAEVVSCEVKKESIEIDRVELIIIVVLVTIVAIVGILTAVEMCCTFEKSLSHKSGKSMGENIAIALSIRANWVKLFATNEREEDTLASLNGIRFFSTVWVVLGHTYLFVDYALLRNTFSIWDNYTSTFAFQIIGNAFLSVESFLFITGVLISYNIVKNVDAKGARIFNVPVIVIHRVWRLLPSAMLVVGLTILLPFLGSGPMWNDVAGGTARNCRNNWWPILVFANNFTPFKDSCLPHTWYIAVDFQLFFVALIFLFIFLKKPIAGYIFNGIVTILGIVAAALMTYYKEYPPGTLVTLADKFAVNDITNHTYFLPQVHLGVYAAGLTLGAYLARNAHIHVSKRVQVIGWSCAVLCNATILFIVRKWNSGVEATAIESIMYACLHRTGWAVGLTWLTLMCATGRGGYINDFLSWSGYKILNRLSYLVFLVHVTVYTYFIGNLRGNMDVTHIVGTWAFLGNLMVSFMIAFVLRVLFEAPALELERLFFTKILGLDKEKPKLAKNLDFQGVDIPRNGSRNEKQTSSKL